jgi:hypothetical protein
MDKLNNREKEIIKILDTLSIIVKKCKARNGIDCIYFNNRVKYSYNGENQILSVGHDFIYSENNKSKRIKIILPKAEANFEIYYDNGLIIKEIIDSDVSDIINLEDNIFITIKKALRAYASEIRYTILLSYIFGELKNRYGVRD